jgi:hypothetical protein
VDQPDWKGPLGEAFDQALAYLLKLDCRSRADVARRASELGLLSVS